MDCSTQRPPCSQTHRYTQAQTRAHTQIHTRTKAASLCSLLSSTSLLPASMRSLMRLTIPDPEHCGARHKESVEETWEKGGESKCTKRECVPTRRRTRKKECPQTSKKNRLPSYTWPNAQMGRRECVSRVCTLGPWGLCPESSPSACGRTEPHTASTAVSSLN